MYIEDISNFSFCFILPVFLFLASLKIFSFAVQNAAFFISRGLLENGVMTKIVTVTATIAITMLRMKIWKMKDVHHNCGRTLFQT